MSHKLQIIILFLTSIFAPLFSSAEVLWDGVENIVAIPSPKHPGLYYTCQHQEDARRDSGVLASCEANGKVQPLLELSLQELCDLHFAQVYNVKVECVAVIPTTQFKAFEYSKLSIPNIETSPSDHIIVAFKASYPKKEQK